MNECIKHLETDVSDVNSPLHFGVANVLYGHGPLRKSQTLRRSSAPYRSCVPYDIFLQSQDLMLNCKRNASDSKTWSWISLGVHCFGIQQVVFFVIEISYLILQYLTYVTPRFRGFDGNDSRRHHVALANGEACSNQSELGSFLFRLQEKVCDEIMSRGLMWFGLERRKASFRHASRQWLLSKREKREMLHHWKRGIMLYNNYVI